MFKLLVSYDVGRSYDEEDRKEDGGDFIPKCVKLDKDMLRWVIVDDDVGKVAARCAIHKKIMKSMAVLLKQGKKAMFVTSDPYLLGLKEEDFINFAKEG